MSTQDEMLAALLAASKKRKGPGAPRKSGPDLIASQVFKIARRTLELGGKRSHQTQAIREVLGVKPKGRNLTQKRAIDKGKKWLRRKPLHKAAGEIDYEMGALQRLGAKIVRDMSLSLDEINHRLRNVPENRRGPLMRMAMVDLLDMLRAESIDGNFPLEMLEDFER